MSLTVAVQMDPLESIGIAGDSTFALMLKAQERGHRLFHYLAKDLSYEDGRVWTKARPVTVQRVEGNHFSAGDYQLLDLAADVDVVLMRQDPPFDIGYITATYLLERVARDTLVVNDPRSVRDAPEKLFVLDFAQFMPPTMISRIASPRPQSMKVRISSLTHRERAPSGEQTTTRVAAASSPARTEAARSPEAASSSRSRNTGGSRSPSVPIRVLRPFSARGMR